MANLIIENTGLNHIYPDGVPIVVAEIAMSDIYKKVARVSSLAVLTDPYFEKRTTAQKMFSEFHAEGDRVTKDFLEDGAKDILPVFQSLQKWIPETPATGVAPRFEFDNAGKIIYRWQNMETRGVDWKLDYTSGTFFDTRIDPNIFENVKKYLKDALEDYVMMMLYRTIGYDKKYNDYRKSYELNRQYVAYWVKQDTSLQT